MREIKFRAFTDKGEMIYHFCYLSEYNHFHAEDLTNGEHSHSNIVSVMQFTGFTCDKKKKDLSAEVYEHDIFRHTGTDGDDEYSVVVWLKERGAFYLIPVEHYPIIVDNDVSNEKEFAWLFDDAALYDFSLDVIGTKVGNVYENPELLK